MFDEQLRQVHGLRDEWEAGGALRRLDPSGGDTWPHGSGPVLQEETALELGNPSLASLSLLLWSSAGTCENGRISLVGPDITEALEEKSVPFARVVLVDGEFDDEYESYRRIRNAVYDTKLSGLSILSRPSKSTLWCRVGNDAVEKRFSLSHLGAALLDAVMEVDGVRGAEILFVTSSAADVKRLAPIASSAQRVVDAMMKMYEEQNFDCETCEYQDICDTVMDLRKMRSKLSEG